MTEKQKKILEKYVTSAEDNIFAVKNLEGIVGAVYARYSRAKGGFREILLKEFIQEGNLDPKHADELIARILVAYGDDSVGELEGGHVSFEKISMLATKEIEDHRIGGSPIEQSTRYVFYDQKDDSGWLYYRGDELAKDPDFGKKYIQTMDHIFATYADLVEPMKEYFVRLKSIEHAEYDINGDGIKEKLSDVVSDEKLQKAFKQTYNFDLRAKACDTLRALLPLSTLTNVGVFGNGRFFQTVITHLLSQDLPEFVQIGQKAFKACSDIIPQYVKRAKRNEYDARASKRMRDFVSKNFSQPVPELPHIFPECNMVNYAPQAISKILQKAGKINPENVSKALQEYSDILEMSFMIYSFSNLSLDSIIKKVEEASKDERMEIVNAYVGKRETRRDRPGRGLETGYEYNFDLVTNWGVYKDLMRHRINSQQRQLFTTQIGFFMPEEIVSAGFKDRVEECARMAAELYEAISKKDKMLAQYSVLHGHYVRWSMSFNDREAMHLLELRSTPQGHPNYRTIAQKMHKLIKERSLWRSGIMKFVDHNDYYWSRADSEAKQRVKESQLDLKYNNKDGHHKDRKKG